MLIIYTVGNKIITVTNGLGKDKCGIQNQTANRYKQQLSANHKTACGRGGKIG